MVNLKLEKESSPILNSNTSKLSNPEEIRPEELESILTAAGRAPSGDNCQPWKYIWNGKTLRIQNEPERGKCFFNVNDYASILSFGALIESIRIAASTYSLTIKTEMSESFQDIANVKFERTQVAADSLERAIFMRQTNRFPFKSVEIPKDYISQMTAELPSSSSAKCTFYTTSEKTKLIAKLVSVAESVFWASKQIHGDVFKWVKRDLSASKSTEGLTLDVLGLDLFARAALPFLAEWKIINLLNCLGVNKLLGLKASSNISKSGAVCIISVDSLIKAEIMQAGAFMQRLWCRANLLGMAVQPMTGWVYLLMNKRVDGPRLLSQDFAKELGILQDLWQQLSRDSSEIPVMCFRIGYPTKSVPFSGRRSVKDILEIQV